MVSMSSMTSRLVMVSMRRVPQAGRMSIIQDAADTSYGGVPAVGLVALQPLVGDVGDGVGAALAAGVDALLDRVPSHPPGAMGLGQGHLRVGPELHPGQARAAGRPVE